jgi:hypothetical protein
LRGLLQKSKERVARIKRQPGFHEAKGEVKDDHGLEAEKEKERTTPIMT